MERISRVCDRGMRHQNSEEHYSDGKYRHWPQKPEAIESHQREQHESEENTEQGAQRLAIDANFACRRRRVDRCSRQWLLPSRVVFAARGFVVQHAICFIKHLHFFFGSPSIGVTLLRKLPVQSLDLAPRSISSRTQNLVVILGKVELTQVAVDFRVAFVVLQSRVSKDGGTRDR